MSAPMPRAGAPAAIGPRAPLPQGARAGAVSIAAFFVAVRAAVLARHRHLPDQPVNLLNILRQSAPLLIVAVAMTFVITTGGIDLSVGSTVALVNALAAIALQAGVPWPLAVVLMLALGALIGAVAGLVRRLRGHPGLHRHAGRALDPARRGAAAHPGLSRSRSHRQPVRRARPRLVPRRAAAGAHRRRWSLSPAGSRCTQTRFGRYVTGDRRQCRGGAPRRHRRRA